MGAPPDAASLTGANAVSFMLDSSRLTALAALCRDDSDGHMAEMVRARFEAAGLLSALNLIYSSPVPASSPRSGECPVDWTAYQIGVFDNGDQNDKRGRPRTTKTRFAFDIKVWTGADPNFRSGPDWQATCNFWSRGFARTHVGKLKARGSISEETAVDCLTLIEGLDDQWLFGIPFKRAVGSGTRYSDGHVCAIEVVEGRPQRAAVYASGTPISITGFVDADPSGRPLTRAIGAARISRTPLPYWETQTLVA